VHYDSGILSTDLTSGHSPDVPFIHTNNTESAAKQLSTRFFFKCLLKHAQSINSKCKTLNVKLCIFVISACMLPFEICVGPARRKHWQK